MLVIIMMGMNVSTTTPSTIVVAGINEVVTDGTYVVTVVGTVVTTTSSPFDIDGVTDGDCDGSELPDTDGVVDGSTTSSNGLGDGLGSSGKGSLPSEKTLHVLSRQTHT